MKTPGIPQTYPFIYLAFFITCAVFYSHVVLYIKNFLYRPHNATAYFLFWRLSGFLYRKFFLYPKLSSHVIGKTLDVGCGIGDFLSYKSDAVGVDVNKNNVNFCIDRGLDARCMQPDKLPFDSGSFDNVILDNVLEHIEQPMPILNEINRVITKKGHLLIGVPGRKGYLSDDDHKIFYDEPHLRQVAENCDFFYKKTFYTPFSSSWLDQNVRQYCVYCLFSK